MTPLEGAAKPDIVERCCCGRIKALTDRTTRINETVHERLGSAGAFCGPWWKHDLRDNALEIERLREGIARLEQIYATDGLQAVHANEIENIFDSFKEPS